MGEEKSAGKQDVTNGWSADPVALVTGVVGAVAAVVGIGFGVVGQHQARDADLRDARQSIVADTMEMAALDERGGSGQEGQIELLGAEARALVERYGDDLELTPTTYRLIGQYLAWSTSDLATAEQMLRDAVDVSTTTGDDADPLEAVLAHRLLGDVAAQRHDPDGLEAAYAAALDGASSLPDSAPDVVTYTRVYRLVDAYLGARRAVSEDDRDGFCALATGWSAQDLRLLEDWADRPKVHRQLLRIDGVDDVSDLDGICR